MAILMRETFYGRSFEDSWMSPAFREAGPYFTEGPYLTYENAPPFTFPDGPAYYSEPLRGPGRSISSIPAYGHYPEVFPPPPRSTSSIPGYSHYPEPFLDVPPRGPPRSTSSIPGYNHYPEELPPHPTRSSSSIPAYPNLARESRPKQQLKVHPEIELRVPMCCLKCENKVRDTLLKLDGVTRVEADRHTSKATVSGKVDPQVVLKKVQRFKKKAEFWSSEIYSRAFIDFIQSKTGKPQPEEEIISSFSQYGGSDIEGESNHTHQEFECTSSFVEYGEDDLHDSHDEVEEDSSHGPSDRSFGGAGFYNDREHYNRYTPSYRHLSDISPYGRESSFGYSEERDPRYEDHGSSYSYDPYEYIHGTRDHLPYEHESRSSYPEYSSYKPSQSYGPSGISNPSYIKRIISNY